MLASLFKSRLRQAITHEPDHEVFSSWTTEETARTDYLCLAGGISWWLIQLKSLTAHLSMGPFSLVNGLLCTNQLPPAQSSCEMMPATLRGRTGARLHCSPSTQRHPSLPSSYSLQCPSKAEQEVGWEWWLHPIISPEPMSHGLVPEGSSAPWGSVGFVCPRDRRRKGTAMPAQNHSHAKQSSLYACTGLSTDLCTWGCRA